MGKGITLVEQGHIIQMVDPVDHAAVLTSETILLKNWAHATVIINGGAGSAVTITFRECTSFAGSGATAIGFRYAREQTADGDVLDAVLTAAGTVGVAFGTGNTFLVAEIDTDELSDGYPYLQFGATAVTSRLLSAVAVLSGGRAEKSITATVIA